MTKSDYPMQKATQLTLLKCIIVLGLLLILSGHSLLVVDGFRQYFGMYSYMLGAMCIAIGLILSLPTKIYLTILLMRHEGHDSKL